jgi:hypothetical protein
VIKVSLDCEMDAEQVQREPEFSLQAAQSSYHGAWIIKYIFRIVNLAETCLCRRYTLSEIGGILISSSLPLLTQNLSEIHEAS